MPTRLLAAWESDPDLQTRLLMLGVSNPALTLKRASLTNHTLESITALIAHVESLVATSPTTTRQGRTFDEPSPVYPWGGGAIHNRLTNALKVALPAHDGWPSVDGVWSMHHQREHPPMTKPFRPLPTASGETTAAQHRLAERSGPVFDPVAEEARWGAQIDAMTRQQVTEILRNNAGRVSLLKFFDSQGLKNRLLRVALRFELRQLAQGQQPLPEPTLPRPQLDPRRTQICHRCQAPCTGHNQCPTGPLCDPCLNQQLEVGEPR